MSITVKRLREELAAFPDDALCHAYEGEATGIGIQDVHDDKSFGFIHCLDGRENEPPTDRSGQFANLTEEERAARGEAINKRMQELATAGVLPTGADIDEVLRPFREAPK